MSLDAHQPTISFQNAKSRHAQGIASLAQKFSMLLVMMIATTESVSAVQPPSSTSGNVVLHPGMEEIAQAMGKATPREKGKILNSLTSDERKAWIQRCIDQFNNDECQVRQKAELELTSILQAMFMQDPHAFEEFEDDYPKKKRTYSLEQRMRMERCIASAKIDDSKPEPPCMEDDCDEALPLGFMQLPAWLAALLQRKAI